jgi:hypothetical protein
MYVAIVLKSSNLRMSALFPTTFALLRLSVMYNISVLVYICTMNPEIYYLCMSICYTFVLTCSLMCVAHSSWVRVGLISLWLYK